MANLIKLKNIERYFKNKLERTYVLRNINLDVNEGEFISIMGPSGSGKSTLLYILGMLDAASGGEYYFLEEPAHEMSEKKLSELHKAYIGFVFQQYHLIDDLTVYENLETPLLYQKIKGDERKGKIAEVLDRFNIVAKKDLFPNQLSGGQQQLVAIARAIIACPKLILADEPTGSLHSDQGKIIMDTLADLNKQGTTIIQVTHNEQNAAYANRIIQLKDGWIES
ncbi:MAG TPA: ABC transporter ATP-binding protein [Ignavibacteriales bacterium]|nr:ABC transporter ATP-binding protein [Ignavibacteriales bacterium]